MADSNDSREIVPDDVIPHGQLPPLKYRDMPEPVGLRKMIGPGVILAGLALGSGEFVLWPYITFKTGFVFFWACLLGVATQYFINMEITRWTLVTGESAITGFCRLSRQWAWVFLLLNILPWMLAGWAKGAAVMISWLVFGATVGADGALSSPYVLEMSIGGLLLCGIVLTAGPVVYETVEKLQFILVGIAMLLVVLLAFWFIRPDAVAAQMKGAVNIGQLPPLDQLSMALLLGALAFAGVGGTLNLGQSNYVKDKGYGMGAYIGRITSPITGQEESMSEIGYHFRTTDENLLRWRRWWRTASLEHFLTFFAGCTLTLILLTLICYSVFYDESGQLRPEAETYAQREGLAFIWGEATEIQAKIGPWAKTMFLVMGAIILLTTEIGILDATSRISSDIVKVNWLRQNLRWSESRLYFLFLWSSILLGAGILCLEKLDVNVGAFQLFKFSAAMNGGVMFVYCLLLLILNRRVLPARLRMGWVRVLILIWAVLFFGFFLSWTVFDVIKKLAA